MAGLSLPYSGSLGGGGTAFEVTDSDGTGVALKGISHPKQSALVMAAHPPTVKIAAGVWGESSVGTGVYGRSSSHVGVQGETFDGIGVQGTSDQGTGVLGEGPGYGVHGRSNAGSAIYGENTEGGDGVTGRSANGTGVAGISSFGGNGIYGRCDSWQPHVADNEPHFTGKAGFFEGDVQVTGDICLGNADCAEDFDVAAGAEAEPGTVMVLDEFGGVRASSHDYDTRVAGVVSGAGGLKPGIILDRAAASPDRRPLALMGKVYCKVDAANGAIVPGDLLTTSGTLGHAMKVTDRGRAFGAVIGKALGAHSQGTGLIPVLVGLR